MRCCAYTSTMVTLQHIIQQWLRYSTSYLSVLPALNGSSNTSALIVTENVTLLLGLNKHGKLRYIEHRNCSIWWRGGVIFTFRLLYPLYPFDRSRGVARGGVWEPWAKK
jgi:hypothetical protein